MPAMDGIGNNKRAMPHCGIALIKFSSLLSLDPYLVCQLKAAVMMAIL